MGDMLTVNWSVSHACEITFWEVEPDGKRRKFTTGAVITGAGEGSRGWTLKDYGYGRRAVVAEAVSLWGMGTSECEYYVLKKAADVEVKVRDQDGKPLPGAEVQLDGAVVASTDTTGGCVIPEVEFGEHTVTVTVEGTEQSSRIRIASTQKQHVDFVFTVEKRGVVHLLLVDQQGNPLEGADVYIDGFKEGRTSESGEFSMSVSEGSHYLEAKMQNATAETTVTVQRGQTTFTDLTLYLEVDTFIMVMVRDSEGNAVADAGVYLDNIFLGRTDSGGELTQKVASGTHTLRVEKEGAESYIQNVVLQEGENPFNVQLTQEAPAYGILVLLGLFCIYILQKRKQ